MNILLVGNDQDVKDRLRSVMNKRHDEFIEMKPGPDTLQYIRETEQLLILISEYSEDNVRFCKKVRKLEYGWQYTIFAVIRNDHIDHLGQLLDADIDQYIVESLYNEKRLNVRFSFAQKMVENKQKQFVNELRLRESEARAKSILETTVDAIITINQKGIVQTFNQAAENLFQYAADEVIGKNVKILMPQPYRREHDGYIDHYHKTGEKHIIGIGREVAGKRKDGSTFPMYLAVSEVNVNNQRLYTGIVRDITEQRRLEQEVLRISEHERYRIGQDLHDGLGQMLTGITMISKNIAQTLAQENHPEAENLKEVTNLIKESDEYARNLSRGLVPVEFDKNGLNAALERLTRHAEKLFGIRCLFIHSDHITFEDTTDVVHLYRIAQEATSNAVKHGSATEVHIKLNGTPEEIYLKIEDNGSGFPDDWEKNAGLGVRIMKFRARLIGANLQIGNSSLGGALIRCSLLAVGKRFKIEKQTK